MKMVRPYLVSVFEHTFEHFKQHYIYFHTLFHPHVYQKHANNITQTPLPNTPISNSCKSSSEIICIDMQSHLWFLVFTSFLQFLQIFFKVLVVFKSCCALLSLNSRRAWNFFCLESLPTFCVHKYSFFSKLLLCLKLLLSRVSSNLLCS